jgi:hypothetical protein
MVPPVPVVAVPLVVNSISPLVTPVFNHASISSVLLRDLPVKT